MDSGFLQGIWTLVSLVAFVAIALWAYSRKRKPVFEQAARIPLEDDPESVAQHDPKVQDD